MAWMEAVLSKMDDLTIGGVANEMVLLAVPVWTAFFLGLVIGWAWRPRWANLDRKKFDGFVAKILDFSAPSSPCKSLIPSPQKRPFGASQILNPFSVGTSSNALLEDGRVNATEVLFSSDPNPGHVKSSSLPRKDMDHALVNEGDLIYLAKLVEVKDGGPSWIHMMEKSTPTMAYRAWRRDLPSGPPQYRSSTIFEDASPEMVRDFFWDDEFRLKWDDMLIFAKTLEECTTTGTMTVQWIRKFPFFCSDREYIIGRRIWESGTTYYCVTKGVPCSTIPRQDKPRRVDLYYSSWCIRSVESRRGDGQMTSCEVLLFHYEDMGIPWEIAKLGVRQGMWGAVKKIEPGLRAYQKARGGGGGGGSGEPLSRQAFMAHLNSRVSPEYLRSLLSGNNGIDAEVDEDGSELGEKEEVGGAEKRGGCNIPKLLLFGGAVALACSLDRGLLTKAVIFGVARRFGRMGGKMG